MALKSKKYCFNPVPKVEADLPNFTYIDYEIKKIAGNLNKKIPFYIITTLIDSTSDILFGGKNKLSNKWC